jgi:flagellar basal-body rod protein FlgB
MLENIGGANSELVKLALDAAWLRQQVIANNIANVNTPGFSAKRVSFEEHLTKFLLASGQLNEPAFAQQVDSLRKYINEGHAVEPAASGTVQLDQEMIHLTENVLRYQALLDALAKRGSIIRMAINEGKS